MVSGSLQSWHESSIIIRHQFLLLVHWADAWLWTRCLLWWTCQVRLLFLRWYWRYRATTTQQSVAVWLEIIRWASLHFILNDWKLKVITAVCVLTKSFTTHPAAYMQHKDHRFVFDDMFRYVLDDRCITLARSKYCDHRQWGRELFFEHKHKSLKRSYESILLRFVVWSDRKDGCLLFGVTGGRGKWVSTWRHLQERQRWWWAHSACHLEGQTFLH